MVKSKAKDLNKATAANDQAATAPKDASGDRGSAFIALGIVGAFSAILFNVLSTKDYCTIDPAKNIIQDGHKLMHHLVDNNPEYNARFVVPDTVVQFDGILTVEESQRLQEYIEMRHFKASKTLENQAHRINDIRTSQTFWCVQDCMTNPAVLALERLIANITSIPSANYEHLQFLKYEGNGKEYYKEHTDHIAAQTETGPGPRVLTFFFYLSEVEGGETFFPAYDLKVSPKPGRAIVWLNTLPEKILERHPGTRHEALPVMGGTKYAGNVWIHLRNYRDAFESGCHK